MDKYDVVIHDGELITASGSIGCVDIGINNGVIVKIGGELKGAIDINAQGKLLFPGGIDAHVHLSNPPEEMDEGSKWVDDFLIGSNAALAGGITTLGNMTFLAKGETPLTGLAREVAVARKQIIADFFFHPVLDEISPEVIFEIPKLLINGCNSIKIFMSSPKFDSQILGYISAIRKSGESGLITLMHCEDYGIIENTIECLVMKGNSAIQNFSESRPIISEVVATQRAIAIAEATNAPIYIVHVSSSRVIDLCGEAQERKIPVYVETSPIHLFLTKACFLEEDGAKYVGQPPLRGQEDLESIWEGIRLGIIHTVCSDHAPLLLNNKLASEHTITNIRPGLSTLQVLLPLLYSEGVLHGRISLSRFVEVISTNAAKLFGLYPRKGTIAIGSDADIVIFDPEVTKKINQIMLFSNSDYSPFEGWQVTGWPIITLRRGEIVYRDGEITGRPGGGLILSSTSTTRF